MQGEQTEAELRTLGSSVICVVAMLSTQARNSYPIDAGVSNCNCKTIDGRDVSRNNCIAQNLPWHWIIDIACLVRRQLGIFQKLHVSERSPAAALQLANCSLVL